MFVFVPLAVAQSIAPIFAAFLALIGAFVVAILNTTLLSPNRQEKTKLSNKAERQVADMIDDAVRPLRRELELLKEGK